MKKPQKIRVYGKIVKNLDIYELENLVRDNFSILGIDGEPSDFQISSDYEPGSYGDRDRDFITVKEYRLETDKEYGARMKKDKDIKDAAKKTKENKKNQELALLAKLKAKYEK